ncbi:unnamed protein product, partial [Dracunculus medinensis]|uniref:EF-hand domain-containing protein n=1 Tax=Dracunculus medinensis TaxID=318479 RepID=A0A0N4U6Q4_DRAME
SKFFFQQKEVELYKYLQDVVSFLEKDPKFVESARNLSPEEIKSGKIADALEVLSPHVLEKLKELKNQEIQRIRREITKQIELDGGAHNIKLPEHLDITDENFTKDDLRKLIKTLHRIDEIEEKRKEAYKNYEMEKKAKIDHKLKTMTPEERKEFETELEKQMQRKKEEELKHPGSHDQLVDVWEKEDQMRKEDYNSKTFFALHDTNGDGFWNNGEIMAFLEVELDKLYNSSEPGYDPVENFREEEKLRMLNHILKQLDKNGDSLVSLQEFLEDAQAQGASKPDDWKDNYDEQVYSPEELQKFEMEYAQQQGWSDFVDPTTVPVSTAATS